MAALIVSGVVAEIAPGVFDVAITEIGYKARRQRAAKRWGAGAHLSIRVEPEEEAWRHSDVKHLYGHLYKPVSDTHGETVAEVHLRMKAQFMPEDGRTSITQLNRDELKAFIESVEQDIRETDPESWGACLDAMALYERRN